MNPALISLIMFAVQEAIKYSPELAQEFQMLFAKGEPTAADWEALRAKVHAKQYADFVPSSVLLQAGTAVPVTVLPSPAPVDAPAPVAVVTPQADNPPAPQAPARPAQATLGGTWVSTQSLNPQV